MNGCLIADGVRGPNAYNTDRAIQIGKRTPKFANLNGKQYKAFTLFLSFYSDATNANKRSADIFRVTNECLPFELSRMEVNNHTVSLIPQFKLASHNNGKSQMTPAQRKIRFQMQQFAYAAVVALFEQPAKNGIIVSGYNEHGVFEEMIAFPRLLTMNGDNSALWDWSGCRRCYMCNVSRVNLDNCDAECCCGGVSDARPITSSLFNTLRHNALVR